MKSLAVYVHIPFCERRCGYCDFVSCCELEKIDEYLQRLCDEIKRFDFSAYHVKTIYIGGGTPSILAPRHIKNLFTVLPACDGEITIEVNPNSLTAAKCAVYRAVGINRISLGVQSFDNGTLRDLGRLHDVKQAVSAVKLAHQFIKNVSIDLIKDIPGHSFVQPPAEIWPLINHISVYSLTKDDQPVLETDEHIDLPADFLRYEVSNYARSGYESQHNLVYWTGGEYIGFGAGAHSLLNNTRFCNSDDILHYERTSIVQRDAEMVRREQIMLGLRLRSGFDKKLLHDKETVIQDLLAQGLIKINGTNIVATEQGLLLLNQLWLKLV